MAPSVEWYVWTQPFYIFNGESWLAKEEETASDQEGVFISLPEHHIIHRMSLCLSWCSSVQNGETDRRGPLEGPQGGGLRSSDLQWKRERSLRLQDLVALSRAQSVGLKENHKVFGNLSRSLLPIMEPHSRQGVSSPSSGHSWVVAVSTDFTVSLNWWNNMFLGVTVNWL